MNLLDSSPVCVLTDKEFLPKEGMTFATQVAQFFEGQGGIANSPFGTVVLDKKGVQNSKQHGNSRIKSASFAAVKDVLEKGVVIKPLDYYGTNDKKQMTGMIAAPIQIADEKYVCVVVVIANTELQRLYVHESFLTKNLQEVAASNLVPRSNTSSPQPYGEVAKVLHNFLISKQNEKNNAEDTENNIKTENRQYKMKQRIRLTEGDLHRIIRKCVNEATKKDPMKQWFKDMENASEYRERMDYITKGGRKPISRKSKEKMDEGTDISIEQKKKLCQLVKQRAYEIQRIINYMTEPGPNGNNYLEDLIADEPWFKQLQDAVFDMESYGKQYDVDYGPYEDDPIYC